MIGCVVRHYWLWWGLLWLFYWLVRHPKWRFDRVPLSRWDQQGICDSYVGAVDQDCAYGRKCPSVPGLFCQWLHWARKEYDVWTFLTIPSCKSYKSMYGTNPKNIQVLGQLNHRCGMTSKTRSFKIGQEFVILQSENWFETSLVCVRLFLTLDVAMRLIW